MMLMEDDEQDLLTKMVKFAKMQDEFYFTWGMEIEELQETLQYYIDQGEADVAEEMQKF